MQTDHIKVTGMTCGGCAASLTRALSAVPGVDDVKVSLAKGEAVVQFEERLTSRDQLKAAVQAAGYGVDLAAIPPVRER
ncbi:MAG: heavy-metal-associated domain-containing protein [Rhodospirillales bacterium]